VFTLISGPAGDDKATRIVDRAKVVAAEERPLAVVDFKGAAQWAQLTGEQDIAFWSNPPPFMVAMFMESSFPGSTVFLDGIQFVGSSEGVDMPEDSALLLLLALCMRSKEQGFDLVATWTGTVPHTLMEAADVIQ
jgi:hypothetical protein